MKLSLRMVFLLTVLAAPLFAAEAPVPSSIQPPPARQAVRDPRVRQYLAPVRVLWQSPDEQSAVENVEQLLPERRQVGSETQPTNTVGPEIQPAGAVQITLDAPAACTLRHGGKEPGVLLDFGRELHGGVRIAVSGSTNNQPVRLRVRFGESASEAMSDIGEKNATNDHAVRDQTCLVPRLGTHEIGNTGFRFVRIDLVDPNAEVRLKAVRAVFLYRDLSYLGSFRSSDERLNRIWQTGAYTVHLNMQDFRPFQSVPQH